MASIAIMALGAVLDAAAFTGGNYLAKYLSEDSGKAAMDKEIRHDKALEAYQAAYAKYQKDRTKLSKQALWQIYLPAPRYIPRPKFDVFSPNAVHQADPFFCLMINSLMEKKVYKYALTVVDVASRYKAAEPLTSKESDEVSKAFQRIYRPEPLQWPQLLQVDPGREFMGAVTKAMENNKTAIRRGRVDIHRDQAIVERFIRTLAERLFGYQYAVEMRLTSGKRSTEWVKTKIWFINGVDNVN